MLNNKTRYTQAHLIQPNLEISYQESRLKIFKEIIKEFKQFTQKVPLPCLSDLCSNPKKSQIDTTMFQGAGGYLFLYWRLYDFFSTLENRDQFEESLRQEYPDHEVQMLMNPATYLNMTEQQLDALRTALPQKAEEDISFYMSKASIYLLAAQFYYQQQQQDKFIMVVVKIKEYLILIQQQSEKLQWEVLYGIPGFLYILLCLQRQFSTDALDPAYKLDFSGEILKLCKMILQKGLETEQYQIMYNYDELLKVQIKLKYAFYKREYFGGAHGLLGNLQMFLLSYELCGTYFNQVDHQFSAVFVKAIKDNLNYIIELFKQKGNIPCSFQNLNDVILYQFCHGIPGAVPVYLKAFKLFNDVAYLEVTKQFSQQMWLNGMLRKGLGICHGISGSAYTFMQVYQVTQEDVQWQRAYTFLTFKQNPQIMEDIASFEFKDRYVQGVPDNPYSLMLGAAGHICALIDYLKFTGFPGYE